MTRLPIELSWTAKKGKRRMGQMVKIKMMGREGVLHMMMFDERYKRFGIDYENTFLVQE